MPHRYLARYYPLVRMAIPVPGVGYPCFTAPFATFPQSCPQVLVRLACLIHAANVRSEPGSNPSRVLAFLRNTGSLRNPARPQGTFLTAAAKTSAVGR